MELRYVSCHSLLPYPMDASGRSFLLLLPAEGKAGPAEGSLQISSINHRPESNVTNILQLEETAVGSEPSISSPHDPPFIGCSSHSFRPATHYHTHTHTHTRGCTNRLDRKWEGWDCVVLRERVKAEKQNEWLLTLTLCNTDIGTVLKDSCGLLQLGPYVILAIICICYDNIILTKIIAEIWEHGNITITESDKKHGQSDRL